MDAISVFYPSTLVRFDGLGQDDESSAAGEVLASFFDSEGCRVTLCLRREALEELQRAIAQRNESCLKGTHACRAA